MAVNINVKLNADDSSVKKKLSELGKAAKKGLNFGSGKDGTPTSTGRPSKASTILEKAMNDLAKSYKKEKQLMDKQGKARYGMDKLKSAYGKAEKFVGSGIEGIHTGSSLASRGTSGQGEFISGGFMGAVHDKVSAVQDVYAKSKEGMSSIREAYKGQAEVKDEQGNVLQKERKGGFGAAAVAGIPVVGGMIGAAAGGILQMVHDIGQEYTSTMATQQGTIGATRGYKGGGGGYFANPEMARSEIALRRTQGQFGFGKGAEIKSQDVKFASQQNIGLSQYVESLGKIKEQDKEVSTNFLRGAADINKMTGLKQGQFVQKLAGYSESLKNAGFNKQNIKQFASLTGGLAQAGMKGERAFTVGQTLNEDVRKGVGGGVMSKLALAKLMSSGKSYFEASQQMQEEGLQNEETRKAYGQSLEMFSPEIRGQIMQGQVTRKEAGLLTSKALDSKISPLSDITGQQVGFNKQLDLTNRRAESVVFGTEKGKPSAGAVAADLSHKMAENQLKLFNEHSKELKRVTSAIETIEEGVFKGIDSSLKTMEKYFKAFEEGTLMKQMGKDFKEGFGSIFN